MSYISLFQVILLIYEYTIAVEWSIVQRRRGLNGTNGGNITKDNPHADKLDRSFFGFDQEYYERMPLLVNALQESNYIDPVIEMSRPVSRNPYDRSYTTTGIPTYATDVYKQNSIKRTSPRPFYFEYRSATPLPFSKTYGSRSWVDSYRNAQRLQNIRQVIKYLEKTINAKAADMHIKTSGEASIAFSGIYVEPTVKNTEEKEHDQETSPSSANKVESDWNHKSDPYFKFKPDTPGEVNLLADSSLRFLPMPTSFFDNDIPAKKVPMFKRIPNKKTCSGHKCNDNIQNFIDLLQSSTEHTTENPATTKSFSVMLNLHPLNTNPTPPPEKKRFDLRTRPPINKIYITTTKPAIQFRKKTTPPVRRHHYRYKKPRYLIRKKDDNKPNKIEEHITTTEASKATTMVVHVNVYSVENKTESMKKNSDLETTTSKIQQSTFTPITNVPELYAGQVEDHHDGSSGVINIYTPEPPIPPQTTVHPYYETEVSNSEISQWYTNPPDVLKFSPEDAKIPEHYYHYETTTFTPQTVPTEPNRRSMDNDYQDEATLIIKLKNSAVINHTNDGENSTFTEVVTEKEVKEYEDEDIEPEIPKEDETFEKKDTVTKEEGRETTTLPTYVPQINGHYRSIARKDSGNQRTKYTNRKRKLEMSMTGFRTYVPMYVEIQRNKTKIVNDDETL